ncbi:extracellular solute-binding protein [Glycomyces luteolus]|jgi:multiple sugar transport system substrate-binding protein|uniref:Extracellular solute-binding protein n=2 Tax=Glycomyces TaxID=58113 RepID=A0A9X3PF15_9ACTN|nr:MULTISPECIES: extracellular solute-binding protein [Glycomyces]MDA1362522.1 extracellular solute-binding protein [Glycomyces luteolus]MDN3239141.1 extracellular solute-binding protein [Glycomyces tritici]
MQRRLILRGAGASAAALTAGSSLTACGTGGGGEMELSDEPVELRLTWWGSDTRAELTEQAIAAFEAEHANITVKGEFKDWSGYWDALATTTAADDSPDVLQMDEQYLASYGSRGALLDLGTAGEFLSTDGIEPSVLETGRLDGVQYAMPIGVAVLSCVVNQDLFDQYGVSLPDGNTWTWDDYAALAASLTEASGGAINGSGLSGSDNGSIRYWSRLHGGELFGEDSKVVLDPQTLAAQWEYWLDMIASGACESAAQMVEGMNAGIGGDGMSTGKIAMGFLFNTQITAMREASGANMQLVKMPGSGEVDANYFKPSMYWSVSSQSEHPAEAALFVDFLVNSTAAADIIGTERGIPSNTAALEHITADLAESDRLAVEYMNSVTPGPPAVVTPKGGSELEPILRRNAQQVYFGEAEPLAAAESFVEELQGEIDAAK